MGMAVRKDTGSANSSAILRDRGRTIAPPECVPAAGASLFQQPPSWCGCPPGGPPRLLCEAPF